MNKQANLLKLYRTLDRLIKRAATTPSKQEEMLVLEEVELLNKVTLWIKNGLIKLD